MDSLFKIKYLKYKQKYLNLKTNMLSGMLTGGAKCPTTGFRQHNGECWHDTLSTLLLYTDGIAETVQEIFDDVNFDVDTFVGAIFYKSPLYMAPFNFEFEEEKLYLEYAKDYILNLLMYNLVI